MAGSFLYTAVLDACVLYPAPLRDLLLSLASEGLFRARWTAQIQNEWLENLLVKRGDIERSKLQHTVARMNAAIEDCLIENYAYLIDSLTLPDENDRHVLAAAIVGHADVIVTFNIKDFPEKIAASHGIEVLHPDDFLVAQYDLSKIKTLKAIKTIRGRLKNPPRTAQELIDTYSAQGLPQMARLLMEAIELI